MSSRESFERWAQSQGLSVQREVRGDYLHDYTRSAWRCWQAATVAERQACAGICDYHAVRPEVRHDYDKGYWTAAENCARQIRDRASA